MPFRIVAIGVHVEKWNFQKDQDSSSLYCLGSVQLVYFLTKTAIVKFFLLTDLFVIKSVYFTFFSNKSNNLI